ncbi:MAG: hypothetical protein OXO48_04755 [Caldilineaceae bacterium]|nr:hypothetical protein [Caldilineaceae bacterium]
MANSSAATSDRAPKPPKPVILLGLGAVGRSLLRQIEEQRPLLEREYDLRIAWLALSDSSGAVAPPGSGFNGELLGEILQLKEDGGALASHSRGRAYTSPAALVEDAGRPGAVVVDCTASDETLDALFLALERGYQVVLANKKPLTAAQKVYDRLIRIGGAADAPRSLAALRYETTVGAGLPVIATLDRLVSSGDEIERIAGSFSGTLGFLMTGLEQGRSYSETVQEAYRLGYTEPDPRDDLGGVDVARKALILARGIGWRIEMAQVQVSGLYPDRLAGLGVDDFLSALPSLDEEYRQQVARAASEGKVLRYAATLTDGACSVGLTAVAKDSPLGRLTGTDNLVEFYSRWYSPNPLVIQGRGAGVEATAAGVLSDIVELHFSSS